ncbi:hypothetical protein DTO10_15275 [Peribacillus butanolivorans]|uniref:D-isomer specific 2-hydroxyacid dehydrogenase catalytic domain-containing protein n=1 Tax=Peribacillus butanolivorans TaxID=421767 RepID=A0ABN5N3W4_9BACI|nr:hypothetical protein DTO10_15275 [Peribacillus butanolivorans]
MLLTYGEDLTDETIEKAPNLKWVMVMSAGMELMPFKAIEKRGILVVHAWDAFTVRKEIETAYQE